MLTLSLSNRLRHSLVALLVAVTLSTSLVAPAALAAPLAQTDDELVGDFATTIPDDWVPKDVANSFALVGRWRLSFMADGTYEAARLDVGTLVTGTYVIEGNQVTVTDLDGLMSCASGAFAGVGDDISTGTYEFEVRSGRVAFTLVEDGCLLRQTLFTVNDFTVFVACTTPAMDLALNASTEDESAAEPAATPQGEGTSPLDVLALDEEADAEETEADAGGDLDSAAVAEEIDVLLGQLTACWSTGDPARFLPLLSEDFRGQFLTGDEEERQTAIEQLRGAMQIPLTWERAGELSLDGDDRASAVVRTTALDEEEFVRYVFVLEDGEWRWDSSEA